MSLLQKNSSLAPLILSQGLVKNQKNCMKDLYMIYNKFCGILREKLL